ncbi:HD domain-containing protein [Pedobacter gandavensis]|uniref:HD domain-containing protein n=1 Tax=Pedobacter gandavensis TaxID=2679963 RepID=A0ABR6F302_9SPHI|nr:HD domain-containing protein [Pedobacter gandavensis]MBB2151606.1 HD domain-containing protein [Pedobacter gandavensis]
MNLTDLAKQMAFIHEIDKLKYIQRKTRLFNSERHENDAEHSWHLAMMAMVLAEHANEKVDIMKVVKMLLIHDIVEIDSGDIFLYDSQANHDNTAEEQKAAVRIFGLLPDQQAEEFISLWEEFEAGITAESKFAKSIDRLEPVLQNVSNEGGTWSEYEVKYDTVIKKTSKMKDGSQVLWDHTNYLFEESISRGILKKD